MKPPASRRADKMTGLDTLRRFTTPMRVIASEEEQALLATGTTLAIDHGGQRLAAWRFGAGGPRVLLVHGWNSRGSHLGGFVAPLVARGHEVILFDGPAHGESEGMRSSVVHQARALRRVADVLGPIDAVIAHSIGSTAALVAFAEGLRVRASVHLAGPTSGEQRLAEAIAAAELLPAEAYSFRRLFAAFIGMPASSVELEAVKHGLRHPGLLIHDPADRVIPFAESEALHWVWRASTLFVVDGVGHARILRAPSVVSRAVDWITAQRARTSLRAA